MFLLLINIVLKGKFMTEKTIDHYSFSTKEVLGSGAFGTVFKAIDIKSNKVVALKMISKDKVLS